ncbi:MAG: DUF1580 domain-containing protein [Planctomycetaceae bacterium]|nr:DUF1580 domain-containing protein [Planctomycetaceae bacterium]
MVDVTRETILSVEEAAERAHTSPKTIYSWFRTHDHKGRPKQRVLESAKLGGKRITSLEALQRYVVQGMEPRPLPVPAMSVDQQLAAARQALSALGLNF